MLEKTKVYEAIKAALTSQFVNADDVARILALALVSGRNVLLYGPGGHGKSEMTDLALATVMTSGESLHKQSCGEGLTEDNLWGGLNFRKLKEESVMEYFVENSFLNSDYAVLEEIFDAPSSVLLALKDTLTAKCLHKGHQTFPMKTRCVIALTNKSPEEMCEEGQSVQALLERFPLQMEVKWESYKSYDYLEMFKMHDINYDGEIDASEILPVLAELIAKMNETSEYPVSPRTAGHALVMARVAALMRGSKKVEKVDLLDMRFLGLGGGELSGLKDELEKASQRAIAEREMKKLEEEFEKLMQEMSEAHGPIKFLQAAHRFEEFSDKLNELRVTDDLSSRRKELREKTDNAVISAKDRAYGSCKY